MTEPANSTNKPTPADTPSDRPDDKGHKAKVRKEDKIYDADEPHSGNVAQKREKEEQPVNPVKTPPKD